MSTKSFKELEQFDNDDGDYGSLDGITENYAPAIGEFLIVFSSLEHAINLVTADMIDDRSHDAGYRMLTLLGMRNKIDFLYKILLNFISVTNQDKKTELINLKKRLEDINTFRNKIVHANWGTLKKDGTVRTKIITDKDDGYVKFENVKISPEILGEATDETDNLISEIDSFFMEAQNAALQR